MEAGFAGMIGRRGRLLFGEEKTRPERRWGLCVAGIPAERHGLGAAQPVIQSAIARLVSLGAPVGAALCAPAVYDPKSPLLTIGVQRRVNCAPEISEIVLGAFKFGEH